jgi:hypothetical protein
LDLGQIHIVEHDMPVCDHVYHDDCVEVPEERDLVVHRLRIRLQVLMHFKHVREQMQQLRHNAVHTSDHETSQLWIVSDHPLYEQVLEKHKERQEHEHHNLLDGSLVT